MSQHAEHPGISVQHRDPSPAAKVCAGWFRQLGRALKTCRLHKTDNPLVRGVRESVVDSLLQLVRAHNGWHLRFVPDEILLGQERIISLAAKSSTREETMVSPEGRLPFLFYRDGIRALRIQPTIPRSEAFAARSLARATRYSGPCASAMPTATGRPWPREPVENSAPGTW